MPQNKKKAQSWRDLRSAGDSKKSRPLSLRARVKSAGAFFKRLLFVAALGGILGGVYYAYDSGVFEDMLKPGSDKIKAFEMKSSGYIGAEWVYNYIGLPKGSTLSGVNIFFLKGLLEGLGQVEQAHIIRKYPHTLRIEIAERAPIAKIAVRMDASVDTYLMSADGKFFKGVCIPESVMAALPSIGGIKMVLGPEGMLDYPFAGKVAQLLEAARARLPEHAKTWRLLELSELSSLTVPLISVETQGGVKIVFAAKEYEKQLDRLDYILKYLQANPQNGISRIDLSLSDRAIILPLQ